MSRISTSILFLSILSFFACDNEEFSQSELLNSYVGIWEVQRVSGGFTGQGLPLTFDKIILSKDGNFAALWRDTIVEEGTYLIYQNSNNQDVIQFDDVRFQIHDFTTVDKIIELQEDGKLTMFDTCCLFFAYYFKRSN